MNLKDKFKKILLKNIEGMTRDEAEHYIENEAIPSLGNVSGLVYYSETEPLVDDYFEEMVEAIKNYIGEFSCPSSKNELTWMAWEAILPEIKEEVLAEIQAAADETN